MAIDTTPTTSVTHPLEPLTATEIEQAVAILHGARDLSERARLPLVVLHEPAKDVVLAYQPGSAIDRQAMIQVLEPDDGTVHEAIVSITRQELVSWRGVPGVQPSLTLEELGDAVFTVIASERWKEALAARGITDLDNIQVDPWPAGNFARPEEDGKRLVRCLTYVRDSQQDNGYARPVEGLITLVDLNRSEVIDIVDHGPMPLPPTSGNYDEAAVGGFRTDLKPLEITQPEGPSFTLEGNELRWQKWRLRFTLHPIEGLVLYTVGYEDGGRVRSVLHRAGIAEMVVPYGDPAPGHFWKNAFDAGEMGLGRMANSLTLGCDCLGEIRYADAVLANGKGEPYVVENAVCIHEEDYGILWKHVNLWSGTSEVRRSRRLVISSIATVGNYEYGFYWYLYQDGTIQLEVKLTGILQTAAIGPDERPGYGEMIAPQLYAPNHQHFFCVRLDLDVDGPANAVYEVDAVPAPPEHNPHGNAFVSTSTLLASELAARRRVDATAARTWKVVNPNVRNSLGEPVGYRLVPGPTQTLLADPSASISSRAAFATNNLWVTPYSPDERRAAGDYPNQSPGGDGLPAWTAADRALDDTDIVLWYTFGVTHIARPEDWPVMPVEYAGFSLKPVGFFDRNPALDVPPSNGHCHS